MPRSKDKAPRDWKADLASFRALDTTVAAPPEAAPEPRIIPPPHEIILAQTIRQPPPAPSLTFHGKHAHILNLCEQHEHQALPFTPEYDVEGSLNCGKTTMAIYRQLKKLERYPGIWAFAFRYSDNDTKTKLRPAIELIASILKIKLKWDAGEMFYHLDNDSRLYSFGLKAVDLLSRYDKLRGLGVSDIYNDQAESTPKDIAEELRGRLRPDLRMTLQQKEYPRALLLTPNPAGHRHWLTSDYPTDNRIEGRFYFSISIYDNAHNIGANAVRTLESSFPATHAKHAAMVLGKRGMNVIGDAIFEDTFSRALHVRELKYDPDKMLYEAFSIGKHCPCWVVAQRGYAGGWHFLGGIIGQDAFLEDFLPTVVEYRHRWFGDLAPDRVSTCHTRNTKQSAEDAKMLKEFSFVPVARHNSSSPDVMLASIEQLASYMRRRDGRGQELFGITSSDPHWLRISKEGVEMCPFVAQGFEAGMVWDEHFVSFGNKQLRQLKEDDWFEHGLHCAIALELNFGKRRQTQEEQEQTRRATAQAQSAEFFGVAGPQTWLRS